MSKWKMKTDINKLKYQAFEYDLPKEELYMIPQMSSEDYDNILKSKRIDSILPDGTHRIYTIADDKFKLRLETLPIGRIDSILPDGTHRIYTITADDKFKLRLETLPNGLQRQYNNIWGDQLFSFTEIDKDGNCKTYKQNQYRDNEYYLCEEKNLHTKKRKDLKYDEDGVSIFLNYDKKYLVKYDYEGNLIAVREPGRFRQYDKDGTLMYEEKDGQVYRYCPEQEIKEEETHDPSTPRTNSSTLASGGITMDYRDRLGRIKQQLVPSDDYHIYYKAVYDYYGDTENLKSCREFIKGKEVSYTHYSRSGVENAVDKCDVLQAVASERMEKEDRQGRRLPKMNKIQKSIAMYKAMRKIKNGR
ncbi:MAG: hypothetical protein NC218_10160 [Acetobacter sp.]|nr:hypothetical protein [Acetobacter sp.]